MLKSSLNVTKLTHRQAGTFDQYQLECLRHAFIALADVDGAKAQIRTAQATDLGVLAGLDPASQDIQKLTNNLLIASRGKSVATMSLMKSACAFLRHWYTANALAFQLTPSGCLCVSGGYVRYNDFVRTLLSFTRNDFNILRLAKVANAY